MSEKYVPTFTLNDGVEVPAVGLGTWQMQGDEVITAVRSAIDTGYRHIDTAAFYQNEADIGRAIHDAISAGDVTREELFITSFPIVNSHKRIQLYSLVKTNNKAYC